MTLPTIHRSRVAAQHYGGIPVHAALGVHDAVVAKLRTLARPDAHILELGAGSGALAKRLADEGFTTVCLDLSGADWHLPDHPLVEADLNQPGWEERLPRSKFEIVLCVEVIEHLHNPSDFAKRVAALMPPGGHLILTTPNPLSTEALFAAARNNHFTYFTAADFCGSGHRTVLTPATLGGILEEQGLRVIEFASVGRILTTPAKRIVFAIANALRRRLSARRGTTSLFRPVLICTAVKGSAPEASEC